MTYTLRGGRFACFSDFNPRAAQRLAALLAGLLIAHATAHAETPPAGPAAPAAPESNTSADGASSSTDEPFKWDFSWRGWDGLYMSASQKTRFKNPVTPLHVFNFEQVKVTGKIGGRLEVDGAAFSTTGNLTGFDNGVELRRARITAKGDVLLAVPFSYKVEIGYVPNKFTIPQAYVTFHGVRYVDDVQLGQFQAPQGLQVITSSWDIPLMEPAAPLQAIAPATEPGVQIGKPFFERRGTWAAGLFGFGTSNTEYGSQSKRFGSLIGRVTWLAIDGIDTDRPTSNRYLHLGLSGNIQYGGAGEVRYRSRPESYIAPYVIDTGNIDASKAATVGAEVAWVNGPFSAQGEFIRSTVAPSDGGALNFYGFYVLSSWYLTGESRPYNRDAGDFGRLVPLRNFSFGKDGGWGALEVAARYSYTDLTDGMVRGGRLSLLMTSLNWYLRPQLKWMFEIGAGSVHGGASDGNMVIVQTRVGIDF